MKIVFLNYEPLTSRDEKIFYMKEFIANGLAVEYWDLKSIYFKNVKWPSIMDRDFVRVINDFNEFVQHLRQQDSKSTIYVDFLSFNIKIWKYYYLLFKYARLLVCFKRFGLYSFSRYGGFNIKKLGVLFNPRRLLKSISNVISNKLGAQVNRRYSIVFTAGKAFKNYCEKLAPVVEINHFDYDEYLLAKSDDKRLVERKYCVFLDVNLPFHHDFKLMGMEQLKPEKYYESLINLFKLVENKFGLEVVIAAHPTAAYDESRFGGRKVIANQTNKLVRDCEFVFSHCSTAISFPVIYYKPIVFIYTDEMKKLYKNGQYRFINELAAALNCDVYNIDALSKIDIFSIKQPDIARYNAYKYGYLTSKEVEHQHSLNIILKHFSKLSCGGGFVCGK